MEIYPFGETDDPNAITTGTTPQFDITDPTISVSQSIGTNSTGTNDTLSYSTSIQRHLSISSSITTASGTLAVSWTQVLNHTDAAQSLSFGNIQSNIITTDGRDTSLRGAATSFIKSYYYPLFQNSTFTTFPSNNKSFIATL